MLKEQIDSLLDRVQKPARYMGGEMNCVLKDPNSVDIRYAFAFPDVYEVGMSHLGSRILYDIIIPYNNNIAYSRVIFRQ